ncbi:MAG: BatD family protein [Sulfurovum sp.]|nr:BatD family protein [Sulfurovum sp.]
MKHSLGRFFLLLFILFLPAMHIEAEDFSYHFNVDKNDPYVKESVLLTFDINQTNHDVILLFDFDLIKNKNYTYQRVNIQESSSSHALQIRYTYLIYPLHNGNIDIEFKLRKKVTTDDSVAYSFSGDRDNVKGLVTKNYTIELPPLTLLVKSLPKDTQIVGDFTLEHIIKKYHAKVYESLPVTLIIKGKGYTPLLNQILPADINFTSFKEKPIVHILSTMHGSKNTVRYNMALSHNKNFTLPSIKIQAFNPLTEKVYTLKVPSQKFTITDINKSALVDKVDAPPVLKEDWSWLKTFLSYLLIFVSGFFTAKVFRVQTRNKYTKTPHPIFGKIKQSKNKKELLQTLMAYDTQRFAVCIDKLENSLYANGKMNLEKVKKEALDLL